MKSDYEQFSKIVNDQFEINAAFSAIYRKELEKLDIELPLGLSEEIIEFITLINQHNALMNRSFGYSFHDQQDIDEHVAKLKQLRIDIAKYRITKNEQNS